MRAIYAAAEDLLRQAAKGLGLDAPARIPLRLDRRRGVLRSALARQCADNAQELAERLTAAAELREPFSRIGAEHGMVCLTLSEAWLRAVPDRFPTPPQPQRPPQTGPRHCNRDDRAFLLDYTARRCAALARREGETTVFPPELICLLAEEGTDPVRLADTFWRLPPEVRRQPRLAAAVGFAVGFTENSPQSREKTVEYSQCDSIDNLRKRVSI